MCEVNITTELTVIVPVIRTIDRHIDDFDALDIL